MFNATDWTVVASQAGGYILTAATVIYSVYKFVKKEDPKLVTDIEKKIPHGVLTVAEDAVKLVENLVKSPWFASAAAAGKLEAHHVLGQLDQLKAVSSAQTVLMQLGKSYDSLSVEEKVKAQSVLKLALLKLGIQLSDKQIADIFAQVDAATKALAADKTFATLFEQPDPQPAPQA
jgi:hypothetical protein